MNGENVEKQHCLRKEIENQHQAIELSASHAAYVNYIETFVRDHIVDSI